ncbi:MAG: hypothetical protein II967_04720, partial [Deltaproteobacteria bacterium]|nr:hypothetical protein [Deltaproteobacteria bacterium]
MSAKNFFISFPPLKLPWGVPKTNRENLSSGSGQSGVMTASGDSESFSRAALILLFENGDLLAVVRHHEGY